MRSRFIGLAIPLLLVAGLAAYPAAAGDPSARESAFTILKAVAMASSLNILLGYTGYVSFGHIVFFGFGGYVGFWLLAVQGWPPGACMLAGGLSAGLLAYLLGSAILGLRGAYFALATIGANEAVRALVNNLDIFGGPTGLTLHFSAYQAYGGAARALGMCFLAVAALAVASVILSFAVRSSRFGLGLLAIRENEDAAEVMGVFTPAAKTWAYVISAVIPGMVGVVFFFKNGNVEPQDAFPLHASIELLVMVMLGGQGTVLGPVLGALAYQGVRGWLLTSAVFKDVQLSVAGVLLLVTVLFMPSGAVGWIRRQFPRLGRFLA